MSGGEDVSDEDPEGEEDAVSEGVIVIDDDSQRRPRPHSQRRPRPHSPGHHRRRPRSRRRPQSRRRPPG